MGDPRREETQQGRRDRTEVLRVPLDLEVGVKCLTSGSVTSGVNVQRLLCGD